MTQHFKGFSFFFLQFRMTKGAKCPISGHEDMEFRAARIPAEVACQRKGVVRVVYDLQLSSDQANIGGV